jgi:hypothetical protein
MLASDQKNHNTIILLGDIDDVDKIPVCPFLKEVLIKKVREGKQEFILYSLNLIASKERNTFSKKS